MPRFIDTRTGEFVWIVEPRAAVYAILSHTWRAEEDGGEQSYAQVQELRKTLPVQAERVDSEESARATSVPPSAPPRSDKHLLDPNPSTSLVPAADSLLMHPDLSEKIKGLCNVAREAGYGLVWNDACCIDKTSSAELTEAINSMYEWYKLADVCYVYLADVSDNDIDHTSEHSQFWSSRWHTRGWTLQELIAPINMIFLTSEWNFLGTKMSLATTIHLITGIDFDILTGRSTLESVSVARRLSWAAKRRTTRVEDEAYSLLGIFGVHMPAIYGEGQHAFLRLQEEIIRVIPDQSIFAWGARINLDCSVGQTALPMQWLAREIEERRTYEPCLLAPSKAYFQHASDIMPLSPEDFTSRLKTALHSDRRSDVITLPPMHYSSTPQGVRILLLYFELDNVSEAVEASMAMKGGPPEGHLQECLPRLGQARSLALLRCGSRDTACSIVALPIFNPQRTSGVEDRGLSIGTHAYCDAHDHPRPYRVVCLTMNAWKALVGNELAMPVAPVELRLLRSPFSERSRVQRYPRAEDSRLQVNFWSHIRDEVEGPASRDLDVCATRPVPNLPRVEFEMAAGFEDAFRALGVLASPLDVSFSEPDAQIKLTTSIAWQSESFDRRDKVHQHVVLELILEKLLDPALERDTKACISVTNYIHRPPTPGDPCTVRPGDIPSCGYCESQCTIWEAPCAGDGTTAREIMVARDVPLPGRSIFEAEFLIHTYFRENKSPDWPRPRSQRILRVALQCPLTSTTKSTSRTSVDRPLTVSKVWLVVELSEAYTLNNTKPAGVRPTAIRELNGSIRAPRSIPRKIDGASDVTVSARPSTMRRRKHSLGSPPPPERITLQGILFTIVHIRQADGDHTQIRTLLPTGPSLKPHWSVPLYVEKRSRPVRYPTQSRKELEQMPDGPRMGKK